MKIQLKKSNEVKKFFEENTSGKDLRGDSSKIGIDTYANYIIKTVDIKSGCKYLDIGCGDGRVMKRVLEIIPNCEIDGIDISEKLINEAKLKNSKSSFFVGDAVHYNFKKKYDKIFSFSFLQYLSLEQINLLNNSLIKSLNKSPENQIFHLSIPDLRLKNIPGFIKLSKMGLGFLIPLFQSYKFFNPSKTYNKDGSIFHHPSKVAKMNEKFFQCSVSDSDSYYRFDIIFKLK